MQTLLEQQDVNKSVIQEPVFKIGTASTNQQVALRYGFVTSDSWAKWQFYFCMLKYWSLKVQLIRFYNFSSSQIFWLIICNLKYSSDFYNTCACVLVSTMTWALSMYWQVWVYQIWAKHLALRGSTFISVAQSESLMHHFVLSMKAKEDWWDHYYPMNGFNI